MNVHSDAMPAGAGPSQLHPGIHLADPGAGYWVGQAILRLRREIGWRREIGAAISDPAQASLDLVRHDQARMEFFQHDSAASYLTGLIAADPVPVHSAFQIMADALGLNDAGRFVLGLAMAPDAGAALAPVIAACHGDAARTVPSLALAQTLWDDPLAVLDAVQSGGGLSKFGLLDCDPTRGLLPTPGLTRWFAAGSGLHAFGLTPLPPSDEIGDAALATRFSAPARTLEIVPLIAPAAADPSRFLAALQGAGARAVLSGNGDPQSALIAWLSGHDLFVQEPQATRDQLTALTQSMDGSWQRPLRVFLHLTERDAIAALPTSRLGPVISVPELTPETRGKLLADALAWPRDEARADVYTVARDFRLEPREINRLAAGLSGRADCGVEDLRAACRAECSVDFQGLAELVAPAYAREDIVLPPDTSRQMDEAMSAIRGAGRVQHDWGDKGAVGIGLLFAGPPGTGKTMAAQVIAAEENLPLFRVDLSQIVNKYIGETEKNLRRVFDTAEKMRCILFFDEAEALFGKRTEVKDANDRFANVETGYLLQRMEQFSGVAILATNRRKDLDDAFARRLRYIIEFPMPTEAERHAIWERVFPPGAHASEVDCAFLARRFQLTGGHIRSIALNAALQAAARDDVHVAMRDVVIATKRELDKLDRKAGRDAFGPWWDEISGMGA